MNFEKTCIGSLGEGAPLGQWEVMLGREGPGRASLESLGRVGRWSWKGVGCEGDLRGWSSLQRRQGADGEAL